MTNSDKYTCLLLEPKEINIIGSRKKSAENGKQFSIIFGIPRRGDSSVEQSYEYPKDTWTVKEAKVHCKQHGGNFEAGLIKVATSRLIEAVRGK